MELTGQTPKLVYGRVDTSDALSLTRHGSEDKLVCSGEFEAADLRIAGTSTTVGDLIGEVAALRSELLLVKSFVFATPSIGNPGFENTTLDGAIYRAEAGCPNALGGWCTTSNHTYRPAVQSNADYSSFIGSALAPRGGSKGMILTTGCQNNQGGVYQELSGFSTGARYRLTYDTTGGTWSAQTDYAFATMSDVNGSELWSQDFYETSAASWQTRTMDFTARGNDGAVRFETATMTSCVIIDNVAIDLI